MQVRVTSNSEEFGNCGCGRSPTGKCIGWHGLNKTQLAEAKQVYELKEYLKQQMDLFRENELSQTSGKS